MNFKELNYILNEHQLITRSTKVGMTTLEDSGSTHPFWSCLHIGTPIHIAWKTLSGAERGQLVRAAKKLHDFGIPYSFYFNFLKRMGKLNLIRVSPMAIAKYKPKKSGEITILSEYLAMMTYLKQVFIRNVDVIKLNDIVHKALPGSYQHGILKYVHTVRTIEEALENHTRNEVLQILNKCNTIKNFWDALGKSTVDNPIKADLDLSQGRNAIEVVRILQREIRVRLGKEDGIINKQLNKYFNKQNRLNIRGLKVVAGEREL